jgi:ferrous iron transport protein B
MLTTIFGTTDYAQILSPFPQMVVFTLVTMFYIPCIATIAALVKEFGWKKALLITLFEIGFAIILGGVALRVFNLML